VARYLELPICSRQNKLPCPEHSSWYQFCGSSMCPFLHQTYCFTWNCSQAQHLISYLNSASRPYSTPNSQFPDRHVCWWWLCSFMAPTTFTPLCLPPFSYRLPYYLLQLPHTFGQYISNQNSSQHHWEWVYSSQYGDLQSPTLSLFITWDSYRRDCTTTFSEHFQYYENSYNWAHKYLGR